jgi:hypothetical protein
MIFSLGDAAKKVLDQALTVVYFTYYVTTRWKKTQIPQGKPKQIQERNTSD